VENDRLASYVRMYAVLAGGVLAVSASYWPTPTAGLNWQPLTFALLIAIAGLATLNIRIGSQKLSWSWDETALVIGLALLPAEQLVIFAAVGKLASEVARRIAPHKAVFNVSKQTVAVAVAAIAAGTIARGHPIAPFTLAGATALAVGATLYILINDASVALAISLATDVSPLEVLLRGGWMRLVAFVANTVLGFGMLIAIEWDHRLLLAVPHCRLQRGRGGRARGQAPLDDRDRPELAARGVQWNGLPGHLVHGWLGRLLQRLRPARLEPRTDP
jgi:hypothetical protein